MLVDGLTDVTVRDIGIGDLVEVDIDRAGRGFEVILRGRIFDVVRTDLADTIGRDLFGRVIRFRKRQDLRLWSEKV